MNRLSPFAAVIVLVLSLGLTLSPTARAVAQESTTPLADVLNIDATVSTEVVPDLAVVTLAIVREGPDVAPLTKEVNEALARAFADAKSVPGVVAANSGYSTFPRFDSRGSSTTRTGWQVRATIVLKSKDFAALGTLVGRLSNSMQISGSGFEISPELRQARTAALIEDGARAFQEKALATTRAFGYAGYGIRQITVGGAGQFGGPRPMAMSIAAPAPAMERVSAPLPVESGQVTLSLTVNGSLQMRR